MAGVATNSKGEIFVYTRTGHPTISIGTSRAFSHGGSRLFQFDKTGKYTREIGQDTYGFMVAQQVRVDPQDNIWTVDQMTNMVIKWDPAGQVQMLLGRKAEADRVPALAARAAGGRRQQARLRPAAGAAALERRARRPVGAAAVAVEDLQAPGSLRISFSGLPTWRGTPRETSMSPTASAPNSRVAKFDKNGKFVKSWGSTGTAPGQFSGVHGIAIDAKGNVYVADAGNKRIQVFDS